MLSFSSYLSNSELIALIGARLKEIRLSQQLTQQELAERTGLAIRTISLIEGGRDLTMGTLISIIRVFDLIDNLESLLPKPLPTIEYLKKLTKAPPKKQRVRKSKVNHE